MQTGRKENARTGVEICWRPEILGHRVSFPTPTFGLPRFNSVLPRATEHPVIPSMSRFHILGINSISHFNV